MNGHMDVSFNEPSYERGRTPTQKKASFLSRLVIKCGLASDEQGAQRVMLILLIVVLVLLAAVLVFGLQSTSSAGLEPLRQPLP